MARGLFILPLVSYGVWPKVGARGRKKEERFLSPILASYSCRGPLETVSQDPCCLCSPFGPAATDAECLLASFSECLCPPPKGWGESPFLFISSGEYCQFSCFLNLCSPIYLPVKSSSETPSSLQC